MHFTDKYVSCYAVQIIIVLCCIINSILGFTPYSPRNYDEAQQMQHDRIKCFLKRIEHVPLVSNWPEPNITLAAVTGVALDAAGNVLAFHAGPDTGDRHGGVPFSDYVYLRIGEPPIPHDTVLVFNDTGALVDMWGKDLFHMPHGITVDKQGNVWLTDIALHQVFKFNPRKREQPELVLGEKFVPGKDERHFCHPNAVAVLSSGEFFVADGYCNNRIMKFSSDGELLLQWGRYVQDDRRISFNHPHALTLAEDRGLVCVADRENGRVVCFRTDDGTYAVSFENWLVGPRLTSVAYSPASGGRLYVVNGPDAMESVPVRGYVIDFESARLVATFAPPGDFRNPYDIVASSDGSKVYVAEFYHDKLYKFEDVSRNETKAEKNASVPVKPTTTVDQTESVPVELRTWWRGAAGGAAAAGGVALLALAALALRAANICGN